MLIDLPKGLKFITLTMVGKSLLQRSFVSGWDSGAFFGEVLLDALPITTELLSEIFRLKII